MGSHKIRQHLNVSVPSPTTNGNVKVMDCGENRHSAFCFSSPSLSLSEENEEERR